MKTVTCKSGVKGWQGKLQAQYSTFVEFQAYSDMYGLHTRLGFLTPELAWQANPTVRGSVVPEDYQIVYDKFSKRRNKFMPGGIPRWIRCYDNGGESFDRYTVVFTGRYTHKTGGKFWYIGMSEHPFHPQGFGQHGELDFQCDTRGENGNRGWPPTIGRSCHIGKRIHFIDLPKDCRELVTSTYMELWDLYPKEK